MLIEHHALLKSDLAAVLRSELRVTVELFHRYGYPGLDPENRIPFLKEIISLVERSYTVLPAFNADMLKGVLESGIRLENLDFIEGYPANLLIDDFSVFYASRIAIFKYYIHILDMEEVIRENFIQIPLMSDGKPADHYLFADSKAEVGIQVADVVTGLLGKMHSYFTETASDEVAKDRAGLTGTSLENAELLRDLIAASEDTNVAFLNHVASLHDIHKLDVFLRFQEGAYAN